MPPIPPPDMLPMSPVEISLASIRAELFLWPFEVEGTVPSSYPRMLWARFSQKVSRVSTAFSNSSIP